jgi:hypothetical protein
MEQHRKRSAVLIVLPSGGEETKNKAAHYTRIYCSHHWTWKNKILPTQIQISRQPDVPLQRGGADTGTYNIQLQDSGAAKKLIDTAHNG